MSRKNNAVTFYRITKKGSSMFQWKGGISRFKTFICIFIQQSWRKENSSCNFCCDHLIGNRVESFNNIFHMFYLPLFNLIKNTVRDFQSKEVKVWKEKNRHS